MRKQIFAVFFLIVTVMILTACGSEEPTNPQQSTPQQQTESTPPTQQQTETKTIQPTDKAQFELYAHNLTGGTFIKEVKLDNEKAMIEYVKNWSEYKDMNPESKLKKSDYRDYFSTGDKIEKILVEESVRLLRQFPALKEVSIKLPYNGKTHSIELSREEANEYLGFKVEELSVDDGTWKDKFVDPIVYKEKEREKFVDKFVNVE
jgi:Tfp pilus assembly protein PilW